MCFFSQWEKGWRVRVFFSIRRMAVHKSYFTYRQLHANSFSYHLFFLGGGQSIFLITSFKHSNKKVNQFPNIQEKIYNIHHVIQYLPQLYNLYVDVNQQYLTENLDSHPENKIKNNIRGYLLLFYTYFESIYIFSWPEAGHDILGSFYTAGPYQLISISS